MVIILQIVYSLYSYVQGALKQGKKDEHSKHNDRLFFLQEQTCFFSYAGCRFVFLVTAAFSFPYQHAKNFYALEKKLP